MLGTILSSAVVAAIIAAVVAWWTTQKQISIENITRERRNWREKVRAKALEVHDAVVARDQSKLDKLRSEFRAILNPGDDQDKKILDCITVPAEGKEQDCAEEFAKRISLLLKHDWERAKLEAGPALLRLNPVRKASRWITHQPKRQKYEDIK